MSNHFLVPTAIHAHTQRRELEVQFGEDEIYHLPFEYLRVYSPSAEVRGHGQGQEVLQIGKKHVNLIGIEPVGHYAIKLLFSDGHQTGIYTWAYLQELGKEYPQKWAHYLAALSQAGFIGETGRE